jgi:hypothetical protein
LWFRDGRTGESGAAAGCSSEIGSPDVEISVVNHAIAAEVTIAPIASGTCVFAPEDVVGRGYRAI